MAARKSDPTKKYFTPAQANAMLPLVRRIVQDITDLAGALRERQERVAGLVPREAAELSELQREELDQAEQEFERGRERMTKVIRVDHPQSRTGLRAGLGLRSRPRNFGAVGCTNAACSATLRRPTGTEAGPTEHGGRSHSKSFLQSFSLTSSWRLW